MTQINERITVQHATQAARPRPEIDRLFGDGMFHRSLYTDPAIFAEEMVKVFGGGWVFLAHESELPQNNTFKQTKMGLRSVIVTRDGSGHLHGLFNRCTHRASTVCREESGSAKSFQCPYHAWTFDIDGKLRSVPWPDAYGPAFDKSSRDLPNVQRIDTYRGFIFATLNPDAAGLRDHLGGAAEYIDAWLDRYPPGALRIRNGAQRMLYHANWKLTWDNAADGYHPAFSHRSLIAVASRYGEGRDIQYFRRNPDRSDMYVKSLGNGHTVLDQRPAMTEGYWNWIRPMPGMEAIEAQLKVDYGQEEALRLLEMGPGTGINLSIFPNLLFLGNQLQVVEPLAADRTQLSFYGSSVDGLPAELNTLRMRMQEDFAEFGEPDDLVNFEEAQLGLQIPEIEWVDARRGLGLDRETVGDDGVVTGPVTDEHHIRGYMDEWRRLMTADITLTTSKPATPRPEETRARRS